MTSYRRLAQALAQELERHCRGPDPPLCLQWARALLSPPPAGTPLERLGLPTGVRNSLRRAGYRSIEQVAALPDPELQRIRRLGPAGRRALHAALTTWFAPSPHE
jgi:DNA-directed RNA polymerase alpha subunit